MMSPPSPLKNFVCPPGSLYLKIYLKRLKSDLCCFTDHQAGQRRPVGAYQPIKDQQHALKRKTDAQGTAKKVARRIIPGARNKRSTSPVVNPRLTLKKFKEIGQCPFLLLVWIFAVGSVVGCTSVSLR